MGSGLSLHDLAVAFFSGTESAAAGRAAAMVAMAPVAATLFRRLRRSKRGADSFSFLGMLLSSLLKPSFILLLAAQLSVPLTIPSVAMMAFAPSDRKTPPRFTLGYLAFAAACLIPVGQKQPEECFATLAVNAHSSVAEGLAEGVVRRRSRSHHRDPGRAPLLIGIGIRLVLLHARIH